jgi:hypothetical protein
MSYMIAAFEKVRWLATPKNIGNRKQNVRRLYGFTILLLEVDSEQPELILGEAKLPTYRQKFNTAASKFMRCQSPYQPG